MRKNSITSQNSQQEVFLFLFLEFDRKCTDFVCTMVGGLFAFILFFISLIVLDKGTLNPITEHLYETNFPVDSDSRPCGYDKNA